MATSQEGWPLGLQPSNTGIEFGSGRVNLGGSGSFTTATMITGSPTSSTGSSSDLDTESTGSFFHDRSITLGSLIGVSSILELSRRSVRPGRRPEPLKVKKPCKSKPWIFSLCSRDSIDVNSTTNNTPSLGQFLAVERRASNELRRSTQNPNEDMPDEYSLDQPISQPNSLFVDGHIAPPQPRSEPESGLRRNSAENGNNGHGVPMLFSCMCGHDSPNISH